MDAIKLLKWYPIQYLIYIETSNNHSHHMKISHIYVSLPNLKDNDNNYGLYIKKDCNYKTLIKTNSQRKINWFGL